MLIGKLYENIVIVINLQTCNYRLRIGQKKRFGNFLSYNWDKSEKERAHDVLYDLFCLMIDSLPFSNRKNN